MATIKQTLTEKRIASPKGFLLLCSVLGAVIDFTALCSLFAVGVTDIFNYIIIGALAVVDILFVVMVTLTNFRYRYSRKTTLFQIIALAVITLLCALFTGVINGGEVFTALGVTVWWVTHALVIVAYIITSLYATKAAGFTSAIAPVITSAALAAVTVAFAIFTGIYGLYGQGNTRALVFKKGEGEYYTVERVMNGWNESVTVPAIFNGLPVTTINESVFEAKGVKKTTLESVDIDIVKGTGTNALDFNGSLVFVKKSEMDDMRYLAFSKYRDGSQDSYIELGNNVRPYDLDEDEVCVSFAYDSESYLLAYIENPALGRENKPLPVQILKKGEVLDMSEYASVAPYLFKTDDESYDDLDWNIRNNSSKIFHGFMNGEGEDLLGKEIIRSVYDIKIEFDNIYNIRVMDDNDELYEIERSFSYPYGYDPYVDNGICKYVTDRNIDQKMNEYQKRDGFTLSWSATATADGIITGKLSDYFKQQDVLNTVYPIWKLNAPEITSLTATGGGALTYGDDLTITAETTSPADNISLRYEWATPLNANTPEIGTAEFTKSNIYPEHAGYYNLFVTAYSDTVTSLISDASKSVSVSVAPKKLNFSWDIPSDLTYSAQNKPVTAAFDGSQVINGDGIIFEQSITSVKEVGNYTATVALDESLKNKYYIPATDIKTSFTVTPYETAVAWTNTEFIYNGLAQAPTPSATALGSDELGLAVSKTNKNAGSYTATVSTSNKNYKLTNTSVAYTISPKTVSLIWSDDRTFTYNGNLQHPTVTGLSGIISGDTFSVNYSDEGNKNAGSHTIDATLPNGNYQLGATTPCQYTIIAKEISTDWTNSGFIYNGSPQHATISRTIGLVAGDTLSYSYSGECTDAGVATVTTASFNNGNYTFASGEDRTTFTIGKKTVTFAYDTTTFTYNGQKQRPTAQFAGVIAGDDLAVSYSDEGNKDAGSYTVSFTIGNGNYAVSGSTAQSYTVGQREITLSWANSFEYDGTEKTASVSSITGEVDGEESAIKNALSYSNNTATKVGQYEASVEISDATLAKNYKIKNPTCSFTITPAPEPEQE